MMMKCGKLYPMCIVRMSYNNLGNFGKEHMRINKEHEASAEEGSSDEAKNQNEVPEIITVDDVDQDVDDGKRTPVPTLPETEQGLAEKEKAATQAITISLSAKANALGKAATTALRAQHAIVLKREHNSSDDSDSGQLKPARQKLKREEGPVALSKRWGTVSDAVQKEQSLKTSTSSNFLLPLLRSTRDLQTTCVRMKIL
jgi:hypothetical protein